MQKTEKCQGKGNSNFDLEDKWQPWTGFLMHTKSVFHLTEHLLSYDSQIGMISVNESYNCVSIYMIKTAEANNV